MAREFARARRHSRLVRVLKIGLPLVAILIVAGGVGVAWLARALPENVSIAGASFSDGRVVMDAPRIDGFDQSNRPYSMIAERAVQAIDGSGIELHAVSARFALSDDLSIEIEANGGHYDAATETLLLADDIRVQTSDGMEVRLARATIHPTRGSLEGTGPVTITSATHSVEAGALAVEENGDRLRFSGGIRLRIQPQSMRTAEQQPADPVSASN